MKKLLRDDASGYGSRHCGRDWLVLVAAVLLSACSVSPEAGQLFELLKEPAVTQAVVTLSTRPGVQQRILIVQSEARGRATLILFPGGNGVGHFRETGQGFRLSNNFLARSSELLAQEGLTAAIVDVPSDRPSGMSDGFRTSPQHLEDIRQVIRFLSDRYPPPFFLVGTSRGALSVVYLATALREARIRGIILTSSYDQIGALPLEKIRYPVLFIHHQDDACGISSYDTAKSLYERFTASLIKDFVTVLGGAEPVSKPCEALSPHGFLGNESGVVNVIADWVSGKNIPSAIGR